MMEKKISKPNRFWDWIAERYARQPVADEAAYQRKLAMTRDYLRADMKVLEFACGTGSTAIALAPHAAQIDAIDGSRKMIEIANRKLSQSRIGNLRFEQVLVDDFIAAQGVYDVVMGHSILHLLHNLDDVLIKVHGMLAPGGVFISSTVCMGDMRSLAAKIAPFGHYLGVLPYLNVFTEADLVARIVKAGFDIEHQWRPGEGKSVFIIARKSS